MFPPDEIFSQRAVADKAHRSTRSIRNWRDRGLLPAPDLLLGGRDPAWYGRTLNESAAFARPQPEAA